MPNFPAALLPATGDERFIISQGRRPVFATIPWVKAALNVGALVQDEIVAFFVEHHTEYVGAPGKDGKDAEMPRRSILTYAGADLTWTYPQAFPAGVVPVIEAVAVGPGSGSQAAQLYNVQLVGDPTNTSCKLRVNTVPSASVNLLGLGTLNLFQQAPTGAKVHVTARAP